MKKIAVAKNQQIIFGHVIPTGAVYGKFTYSYTRHIVTEYKCVTNKDGQKIFNKNGTPKLRPIYKEVPTTNTVTYSVESFLDYSFPDKKERHLYAYVLFDNAKNWREIVLGDTPVTCALEKMVRDYIKEHALPEPKIAHVKNKKVYTPKFRQANNFDSVFRMRPENTHIINEDVKPRIPIVHTNLDKCKNNTATHEQYTSPYSWEYGQTPKKSGNIEAVAAMNATK